MRRPQSKRRWNKLDADENDEENRKYTLSHLFTAPTCPSYLLSDTVVVFCTLTNALLPPKPSTRNSPSSSSLPLVVVSS
jgi:hypothetical protein